MARLFAENVFRFGRFHVLPSVRFEREVIEIHEPLPAGTRAPINKSFANNTPLFGLGFGNDFGTGNETYVNVSQGYRPVRFLDVAPTSAKPISANNDPQNAALADLRGPACMAGRYSASTTTSASSRPITRIASNRFPPASARRPST
ncbi:MAG: hypothetical protein WDO12_06460 [Pseudomonadota bacterium]